MTTSPPTPVRDAVEVAADLCGYAAGSRADCMQIHSKFYLKYDLPSYQQINERLNLQPESNKKQILAQLITELKLREYLLVKDISGLMRLCIDRAIPRFLRCALSTCFRSSPYLE